MTIRITFLDLNFELYRKRRSRSCPMLARGVRNVIYNYTEAQRKVRSATSNDAWGPSPALMHEIADLTDNVVAYAEIMPSKQ